MNNIDTVHGDHREPEVSNRKRVEICYRIVLNCLQLARIGRPDLLWTVNLLARSVTKWNRACGLRPARLTSYIHITSNYRHYCHVVNQPKGCKLGFFQIANIAGNSTGTKSTSGGAFCAHLDHIRLCRFHALARNRQLHPIASLNLKLFRLMQVHAWRAFPALNLWDSIINILHSKLAATPSLFIKLKS